MEPQIDPPTPQPAPTPNHNPLDDGPVSAANVKRAVKIVVLVVIYNVFQGFVTGLHTAFGTLNQDVLHLGPFWLPVAQNALTGLADGLREGARLALLYLAGPDVVGMVGPFLTSAWRAAANAIRIMSRAVQGKDETDTPPNTKK